MIIVVARVTLHPGKAEKYEATCRALFPQVRAAEPGVVFYNAGRSRDEPDTYRVIEVYRDQPAMDEHIQSKFVSASMPALQDCIATLDIKLHDALDDG